MVDLNNTAVLLLCLYYFVLEIHPMSQLTVIFKPLVMEKCCRWYQC